MSSLTKPILTRKIYVTLGVSGFLKPFVDYCYFSDYPTDSRAEASPGATCQSSRDEELAAGSSETSCAGSRFESLRQDHERATRLSLLAHGHEKVKNLFSLFIKGGQLFWLCRPH